MTFRRETFHFKIFYSLNPQHYTLASLESQLPFFLWKFKQEHVVNMLRNEQSLQKVENQI